MIKTSVKVSKDLEKALKVLQQAKQRVANEKKKQNEKKRKAEKPFPFASCACYPLVNFAFRQKPKYGFYLPTKSMSAPHYPIGRM